MAEDDEITGSSPTLPSPSVRSAPRGSEAGPAAANAGDCLSEDLVLDYLEGRTTAHSRDHVDDHLDQCNDCWLLVQSLIDGAGEASADEPPPFRVTTFSIGSLIAERYRIKSFVGRGGMGEVYLAHDSLMSRTVALKTPLCTCSDDPSALRKFFDEARNADRITHPNICRIHSLQEHRDAAGEHPPVLFFTMEYIDGETLAARLRRGPLPLAVTRAIARQLLEGLRAAHEKRVLHLDFKSDNVMLRRGGPALEAVIMDFGLSRQRDAVLRASQYLRGIGTVQYMALEQLEGQRNLGPAVDVYAFGVVLFEMLTGRLPFQESSLGAMLLKQQRERPPLPSSLRPGLSFAVDAFVMKCLNRSPARRYEDAGAALAAFDALRGWAVPAQPPAGSLGQRLSAALMGLGLLALPASDGLPPEGSSSSAALLPAPARVADALAGGSKLEEQRQSLTPVLHADAEGLPSPLPASESSKAPSAPQPLLDSAPRRGGPLRNPPSTARRSLGAERELKASTKLPGPGSGEAPKVMRDVQVPPPLPFKVLRMDPGEGARLESELESAPVAQATETGAQAHGERGSGRRVEDIAPHTYSQ